MNLSNNTLFMLTIISIVLVLVCFKAFVIDDKSFGKFKANEGKGSLASALLGISVIVGLTIVLTLLFSSSAKASGYSDMFKNWSWNNGVYTYIGVDYTRKVSPQCVEGTTDDRATSNMGLGWQAGRSANKKHELNGQIVHHSCVLGKDRNTYDSLLSLEYRYWIYRK